MFLLVSVFTGEVVLTSVFTTGQPENMKVLISAAENSIHLNHDVSKTAGIALTDYVNYEE